MDGKSCCSPNRDQSTLNRRDVKPAEDGDIQITAAVIPGSQGQIGTDHPVIQMDGEGPSRATRLKPFAIMPTTVTNQMFATFIEKTGYVTDAEQFGWSFVFNQNISDQVGPTMGVQEAVWWRRVDGACWNLINGPGSEDDLDPTHPVVHVSWHDARMFAKWAGGRLPTEAEWEHAARGGLGDVPFPWGGRLPDDDSFMPCNIWQGTFPSLNTQADGYATTAPSQSFEPNGYGLFNMCGNVWEWAHDPYKIRSLSKKARNHAAAMKGRKVLKGGSYMCHQSYCFRYRIPARVGNTPDTTTAHQGFRLAFDLDD